MSAARFIGAAALFLALSPIVLAFMFALACIVAAIMITPEGDRPAEGLPA